MERNHPEFDERLADFIAIIDREPNGRRLDGSTSDFPSHGMHVVGTIRLMKALCSRMIFLRSV